MSRPVAFVTGGSSGIGAACARLFDAHGYALVIGDIQVDKGRELARQLSDAVFVELDVREESAFENAFTEIGERHSRLDCMVNNAAIVGVMGPIAELPAEQYDVSQAIIQRSVVLGTKHAARLLQPQRRGSIVNVASVAGLSGGFSPHVYSACKAAVVQFTKSVALELAEDNVRVNAVCPGNVATPIHTGVTDERWVTRIEKIRELATEDQPMPRMAEPEEIAEAIYWLSSDASSYVTGHVLAVDGGLTAGRLWRRQPAFIREFHPART